MQKRAAILLGVLVCPALLTGAVRRVRVPEDGLAPDVAAGPSGDLILVFATGQNAWFAVSRDDGKTFSKPLQLNPVPNSVLGGGERGPKIAIGKGGTLHVVWMSSKSEQLNYVRREAGREKFSLPRNLLDASTHVDGATVAADEKGNVLVTWLDSRLPDDPVNPISLPIFVTKSRDNGATFSRNQPLGGDRLLRACSCCALKAAVESDGQFMVAFRGAYHNIRDVFLARVAAIEEPAVSATKIRDDEWEFNGCPMSGPSLAARPGELWAAWMSQGSAYLARSQDGGRKFAEAHSPRDSKPGHQNHPLILANTRGSTLFAFEDGTTIRWEVLDSQDKIEASGDAGALTENSRFTGFVDRQGDFVLVF